MSIVEIGGLREAFGSNDVLNGIDLQVVTHEMNFLRTVANRGIFMHQGSVHEMGTPDTLFSNPQTQELRQFLMALHT